MSNRPNRKTGRPAVRPAASPSRGPGRILMIVGSVVAVVVIAGVVAFVTTRPGSEPVLDPQAAAGKQLAVTKGCISCHTSSGNVSEGPTWKGLYGQPVTLADGTTVTADDAYLTRSIREPSAQVVQGFRPTMPTTQLTDQELAALIAYVKALP
jgi:cytochrome c1